MPEKEKVEEVKKEETPQTKFKTVTEELVPPVPSEEKPPLSVQETNNISVEPIKQESGLFLKFFLVTFFATLLALLLAGGFYVYLTGIKSNLPKMPSQSSTPSPTKAPEETTPTPEAVTDFSKYKVSVLNGNGGIGVAGALKAIIEKAGFKVSTLANADNFNFTNTVIQAKTTVPAAVVSALKTSLDGSYSIKVGDPLDPQSQYDIVITVGSK